jgi:lysophospholipase L1-like esterase
MPPCPTITIGHLVDHVHLNEDGYTLFANALSDKLEELNLEI